MHQTKGRKQQQKTHAYKDANIYNDAEISFLERDVLV